MSAQYWYFVYKWRRQGDTHWTETMDVFCGEFHELILMALEQPENWIVIFVMEIPQSCWQKLSGHVG